MGFMKDQPISFIMMGAQSRRLFFRFPFSTWLPRNCPSDVLLVNFIFATLQTSSPTRIVAITVLERFSHFLTSQAKRQTSER